MAQYCRTCANIKDDSAFTRDGSGLSNQCRDCQRVERQARKARKLGLPTPIGRPVGVNPIVAAIAATAPAAAPAAKAARSTAESDYVPPKDLVATWAAVQLSAAEGEPADNLLFTGPSGSGKTEAARYLARLSGLDFVKVDAPAMTDPEAWFGTREVVVEDGAPKTVYHPSVFVEALGRRCALLIDEANRTSDAIRNILLALLDDTRQVTNPITGETVVRHPECFIILTGNVGLNFTGTYAIDPAFYTRALTTKFDYLPAAEENRLAVSRTGCTQEQAGLFVRFANETRGRARNDEEFPPISTREVLKACRLVAQGLDTNTAAHQVIINAAATDGGAESVAAQLDMIWNGIRPRG